jgi:DNA (cytosine-5)-methyltransferase 1
MNWFYQHPHGDAYYNDFDESACAWLRELMVAGEIAPGVIDNRSILDVQPEELACFTQCHFFAGIGGWSLALRLAGWPDDRPVWTGSPPCQPFSVAGENKGQDDERHLAPKFISLVGACRPAVLFGEQVASAAVFGKVAKRTRNGTESAPEWAWLDDLSDRLEGSRYAVGAVDFPSAGVDAPHIRQRTYFGAVDRLANADGAISEQPAWERAVPYEAHGTGTRGELDGSSDACRLADGPCSGRGKERQDCERRLGGNSAQGAAAGHGPSRSDFGMADDDDGYGRDQGRERVTSTGHDGTERDGSAGGLGDGVGQGLEGQRRDVDNRNEPGRVDPQPNGSTSETGPACRTNAPDSFWADPDWLFCRDGKWRPVEPGTFPLAHGVSGRVGLLRGYGNAINPQQAAVFIEAFEAAQTKTGRLRVMSRMTTDSMEVFG